MSSAFRGPLLFVVVLVLLVGGALFLRSNRSGDATPGGPAAPAIGLTSAPLDSADLHASYNEGMLALEARDHDEAARLFAEVPEDDRAYVLAQHALAGLETTKGDYDAALARLDAATRLQPENPEIFVSRAKTLLRSGRARDAEFEAMRALELNPIQIDARYMVALSRIAQGRMEEGMAAYQRARNQDGAQRGLADAFAELQRVREAQPDNGGAHYATAWFASGSGQVEIEREALAAYLDGNPSGTSAENARRRLDRISE